MLKYFIVFTFILTLAQTHSLCTGDDNSVNPIKSEAEKWTGIDVSIVGKYAGKYGHPPRDPYINTDQGDLLLFVFTVAGLIGGIIIGYNFRKLFVEGKDNRNLGI